MPYKLQKQYRYKNFDYSSNATYFVTICTNNGSHLFGEIIDKKMIFSEIGRIAKEFWKKLPLHNSFVILDEFTVMPNHVHGMIIIDNPKNNHQHNRKNGQQTVLVKNDPVLNGVSTVPTKLQPQSESLSIVVRNYKAAVTTFCRKNNLCHEIWQPRYHDRIIRNEKELENVRKYVYNNVINWGEDKYY